MMADELPTIRAIDTATQQIDARVTAFGGTVQRLLGDGVFATFDSVGDAVRCAVDVQAACGVSEPGAVGIRIGIHFGETFESGQQLLGHAINVAARLEGFAEVGTVCVSEAVRHALVGDRGLIFTELGRPNLKNIGKEMTVFRVALSDDEPAAQVAIARQEDLLERQALPSVAVLPFEIEAPNDEQRTVSAGLDDEIVDYLTRFRSLDVVARESSNAAASAAAPDALLGRRLTARYLARGRVTVSGSRLRLRVRLVDALHDKVIWSEAYDRSFEDIFEVRDDVAECAVAAMAVQIEARERELARAKLPESLGAYALMLRGRQEMDGFNAGSARRALDLAGRATDISPHYARAHSLAARARSLSWKYSWVEDREASLRAAEEAAIAATRMDINDPSGHVELGFLSLYQRQHDRSLNAYERALQLNPSDAVVIAEYGDTLTHSGRHFEGIAHYERALRLNPYGRENRLCDLSCAYFFLEDYDKAVRIGLSMEDPWGVRYILAASYAHLGEIDNARRWATMIRDREPHFDPDAWVTVVPDKNEQARIMYAEGLKMAGL